jgi:hypothetical protein
LSYEWDEPDPRRRQLQTAVAEGPRKDFGVRDDYIAEQSRYRRGERTLRKRLRFLPLAGVMLLAATGAAIAQQGAPPFASDEPDVEFSFSIDDDGETLNWSFDPEVDCSDPEALDPDCETATVEPNEEGEFNHGSYVSFFAQNLDEGPGRGCLIAAVAQSGAGMPEDSGQAADSGAVQSPCPAGLWTWLQEKNDGEVEGQDVGPPAFVTENGGGPPDFVTENGGGPPPGAGKP